MRERPSSHDGLTGRMSRRQLLARAANGFGGLALAGLLADKSFGATLRSGASAAAGDLLPRPHFPARARNVIFLYMDGGVSQVDSFDYKPLLAREDGKPIGMKVPATQFDNVGAVLKSPWEFRQRGESGLWVSDLFPHIAELADELCVVKSMVSSFPEHTQANYYLHTGHGIAGRPSMGSWISYGLGSEAADLPGFVVLNGGLTPPGGIDNFANGFLPATYQGSLFHPGTQALPNARPREKRPELQRAKLDLLAELDRGLLGRLADEQGGIGEDSLESSVKNYELASRMQLAVPDLCDISGESEATRKLYGLDHENDKTRGYASQCLLARRLIERGVRFVEVTCQHVGHDRWDQHNNLRKGHADNALATDQPIAGLLRDLRQRGLLDDTLVVWAGEFGRTPMAQGRNGRDHNPHGFSIWMAGGGVRAGHAHGGTDEYGYFAIENKVTMHDLHATILHLLGIDHERLTVRFNARDMRLTDVHGEVVTELLA